MHELNRRKFLKWAGAVSALGCLTRGAHAASTPARVVIVGGGFGGATVAKYLRKWGTNIQVTLVEPNASHISCVLSNLVLTGQLTLNRITLSYSTLKSAYGVSVVQAKALDIDAAANKLMVGNGTATQVLDYDHLVLAPGIDFAPAAGNVDFNLTPHAWQAGPQTTLLKNQLASMRNGDTFVLTVPKSPYRCPPGPYERACVVADYLKRKGYSRAKVVVLDANASIQAEPDAFGRAFSVTHAGMIQYLPNAIVQAVDSSSRSIQTTALNVSNAKVLNYLPNQRAAAIAARLPVNSAGFVPVNPLSYGTLAFPNVHVIGDSCAVPASDGKAVPKSAHMANSQAKICADAIVRTLSGTALDEDIAINSACFSPITRKTASWLSANFIYGDIYDASGAVKGKGMHRLDLGEAPADAVDGDSYEDMFTWSESLFSDSFL